jgi:hypothetical protein
MLMVAVLVALLGANCSGPLGDDDADAGPASTSTPAPTATPTVTPSPTPFIPPTVAVTEDDDIRSCLERNLTPELLVSLSLDDTELTEDILRTCLETTIPAQLMFLLDPLVEDASQCALDTSKTLTNEELLALGGEDGPRKDEIVDRVIDDILDCLADEYGLDFLR